MDVFSSALHRREEEARKSLVTPNDAFRWLLLPLYTHGHTPWPLVATTSLFSQIGPRPLSLETYAQSRRMWGHAQNRIQVICIAGRTVFLMPANLDLYSQCGAPH